MKILIIMGGFFPGKQYGGPPVSVDNFCSLMSEHKCFIVTRNHDLLDTNPYDNISKGWNDRGNCKVLYLSEKQYNKIVFEKIILKINPDVLYLQGVFQSCILPCLQLAKKHGISVLLAPRGELCAGAIKMKKYKKLPYVMFLRAMGLIDKAHFQSTSDEETDAINRLLGCPMDRIHRLDNIPSIPKKEYKRLKKVAGKARFIFLARIHPKKNLLSAIKYFYHVSGEVVFDIYGSIEDEAYWKECQEAIKLLPPNVKCEYKGLVSHEQVHAVFSQYDAFLFPTLSENYGHVIVESLIVGTKVIISDQTPWNDVEENNAGFVCPLNDNDGFVKAIMYVVNNTNDEANEAEAYIAKKVRLEELKRKYESALNSGR